MKHAQCRFCQSPLQETFADLGMSPLSNAYLRPGRLREMEAFFPLHAFVCGKCWLVQLEEFESPQRIFSDYAYFSSFSDSWLKHAEAYCKKMTELWGLGAGSQVVELASNDGYLLQYFKQRGVPVLGVEPAENVARVAVEKGIPTEVMFFGAETAKHLKGKGYAADLLLGNNVLAHVPDLNGFVRGMQVLLKPNGVITMEFPHLLRLMEQNQFDTIYHEHFSYFSLLTVEKVFAHHGLTIFDVEELPTHGGSLRIFARHASPPAGVPERPVTAAVGKLRDAELRSGLGDFAAYRAFSEQVKRTKRKLLEFLVRAKDEGKKIVGYGAAAKGNTLLNYCGVRTDMIDYVVDRSPHKQGLYLPGTHIPICSPDRIRETRPDYVLILPWNLREEIAGQVKFISEWGGQFVVPIPEVKVFS
ncbi:MAG: methyltransferase domain-containing protein [Bacteriovoracia bacterium]